MGVIPMKEESGQEIYTRDHGTVKVAEKTWQDGRFHVVLCPNGAYQHMNGLPIKNEEELVEAFGGYEGSNVDDLEKALNWFKNRHEQLANPPRPIGFHSDGYPVFADGSVPDFDDLYAFFKPGPILTASIVALQQYNERKGTGVAPKELRVAAPKPAQEPGQGGENRAPVPESMKSQQAPAPSPAELARAEALKARDRINAQKEKERVRQAKRRADKKAKGAQVPAQG